MIALFDLDGQEAGQLADDGAVMQAGPELAAWLRDGVPGIRGVEHGDIRTEAQVTIPPTDPLFGLAVLEHVERIGWRIGSEVSAGDGVPCGNSWIASDKECKLGEGPDVSEAEKAREPKGGKDAGKLPPKAAKEAEHPDLEDLRDEITNAKVGDCYESAFNEAMHGKQAAELNKMLSGGDYGRGGPGVKLAHGYPTYTGEGPEHGKPMGHAWVEVGPFAIDHGRVLMRDAYYRAGKIDPKTVSHYTAEEAAAMAVKKGKYGPFENKVKGALFRKSQGLADLKPALKRALDKVDEKYPPHDSEGKFTNVRHSDAQGRWTPERKELHDELVAEVRAKAKPSAKPEFLLMGGGPASGKSHAIGSGAIKLPPDHALVNADDFKAMLPEYKAMLKHGDERAAGYTHEESSLLTKRTLKESFTAKENVVLDGTGNSSLASVAQKSEQARAAGFTVNGEYVTCSTATALARAQARGEATGRFVRPEIIKATHRSVSEVFPAAIAAGLYDTAKLFDTEDGSPVLVVSAVGSKLTIHHPAKWAEFLAKGKA
jgi:predicted ABC-type ATPase